MHFFTNWLTALRASIHIFKRNEWNVNNLKAKKKLNKDLKSFSQTVLYLFSLVIGWFHGHFGIKWEKPNICLFTLYICIYGNCCGLHWWIYRFITKIDASWGFIVIKQASNRLFSIYRVFVVKWFITGLFKMVGQTISACLPINQW